MNRNQNTNKKTVSRSGRKKTFPYVPVVLLIALLIFLGTLIYVMAKTGKIGNPNETEAPTAEITLPQTDPPATLPPETDPQTEPITEPVTEPETVPETEPETEPPVTYEEIRIKAAGDLMGHGPQLYSAYNPKTDTYDFHDCFEYIRDEIIDSDLSILNFETTLCGNNYPYSGYPLFNTPDSILDALKDAGFDLLLFANNHTYDTKLQGVKRTVSKFKEYGFSWLGAREELDDPTYGIQEVGDIKLGMINYTNDIYGDPVNRSINWIYISSNDLQYIDVFNYQLLDSFYSETEQRINELKSNGAELILFFIHWGDEYYTTPNDLQKQIAQKLCDLGVDAIIGSHPHVVQPIEILTSTLNPDKKTICFYSLGNYLSNQNRVSLEGDFYKNTEMGLTVTLTIRKYSTGECMISGVDTMTTWVHRYLCPDGFFDYRILPAEKAAENPSAYGLDNEYYPAEAVATVNAVIGNAVEVFNSSLLLPEGIAA